MLRTFTKAIAAAIGGGLSAALTVVVAGSGGQELEAWAMVIAAAFLSGAITALSPANATPEPKPTPPGDDGAR